jgi:hypothetical protein
MVNQNECNKERMMSRCCAATHHLQTSAIAKKKIERVNDERLVKSATKIDFEEINNYT